MAKATCEKTMGISAFSLRRYGYFRQSLTCGVFEQYRGGELAERVAARVDQSCKTLELTLLGDDNDVRRWSVRLSRTSCHFGGVRYWLLCPQCDRRIGILYVKGRDLACRRCKDLTYESSQITHVGNTGAMIRFIQLDAKLGEFYAEKRTKFWKKQATKRHRQWIAKRLELGRVTRTVAQAYQPR